MTKSTDSPSPFRLFRQGLSPIEVLLSGSLGLLMLLFLGGDLSFWEWHIELLAVPRTSGLIGLGLLCLLLLTAVRPSRDRLLLIFGGILVLLFLSGWLTKPYSLLQGPSIRGEIFLFALLMFSLWSYRSLLLWLSLPFTLVALGFWFLDAANGRLLFSDDNPTFLYRLLLLKENFPQIPFYNPLWNGGIDARDFFATGALNVFLLFSPLIYLLELTSSYNALIILLLFFVLPGATFYSCRILRLPSLTGGIAAILSTSSSLLWYRWALQFGTLGFITSTALLPLVLALGVRYLSDTPVQKRTAIFTIAVVTLTLLWTPAGIACFPLIATSLFCVRRLLRQRTFIPTVLILIALNLPWISLFWAVSNVGSFLDSSHTRKGYAELYTGEDSGTKSEKLARPTVQAKVAPVFKHKKRDVSTSEVLKNLREVAHSAQPLIWIFAIPGILLMSGSTRIVSGLTLLWLILLGSVGPMVKPQLELDRMLVIGVFLACTPAAYALTSFYHSKKRSLIGSLAFGFLIAGVFSVGAIMKNRTVVPVAYQSPQVDEIVRLVKDHAGEGRVLFSGFMLHDFSGGHVAPLPLLSATPIVASSPVHNLWRYQQVFPEEFLEREEAGIEEYLNLMNVTLIFAHERSWKKFFRSRPHLYTPIKRIGKFQSFRRTAFSPSYFLTGTGTIHSQSSSEVVFSLQSPNATLKFNYLPFMTVDTCHVAPVRISESITFTQLSGCEVGTPLTLRSVSPVARWQQAYLSRTVGGSP